MITPALYLLATLGLSAALRAQSDSLNINWPAEYEPAKSKFTLHNEIEVSAPPEAVWALLMDAEAWPEWYEGAKNVVIKGGDSLLTENGSFTWRTMGLNMTSEIREFEPAVRLSWEYRSKKLQAYHAWLIIPTETGCRVITDESQNGWLTTMEKLFQPKKLYRLHEIWLAQIKAKAEGGYAGN